MKDDNKFLLELELNNYFTHIDCCCFYCNQKIFLYDEHEYTHIEDYERDFIGWAEDIFHQVEWTLGLTAVGRIYGEQGSLDAYACDYNHNVKLYNPDFYKFLVEKGIY